MLLPAVEVPHDLVLTGAEGVACKGASCVYVGETRMPGDAPSALQTVRPLCSGRHSIPFCVSAQLAQPTGLRVFNKRLHRILF